MTSPAPFCPSAADLLPAICMLFPPGEAWPVQSMQKAPTVQLAFAKALCKELARMEASFCVVWAEMFAHKAMGAGSPASEVPGSGDPEIPGFGTPLPEGVSPPDGASLWQTELGLPSPNDAFGLDFLSKLRAPIDASTAPAYFERLAENLGWTVTATWTPPSTLHLDIDSASSPDLAGFQPTTVTTLTMGGPHNILGAGEPVQPIIDALDSVLPADAIITYTVV